LALIRSVVGKSLRNREKAVILGGEWQAAKWQSSLYSLSNPRLETRSYSRPQILTRCVGRGRHLQPIIRRNADCCGGWTYSRGCYSVTVGDERRQSSPVSRHWPFASSRRRRHVETKRRRRRTNVSRHRRSSVVAAKASRRPRPRRRPDRWPSLIDPAATSVASHHCRFAPTVNVGGSSSSRDRNWLCASVRSSVRLSHSSDLSSSCRSFFVGGDAQEHRNSFTSNTCAVERVWDGLGRGGSTRIDVPVRQRQRRDSVGWTSSNQTINRV